MLHDETLPTARERLVARILLTVAFLDAPCHADVLLEIANG